MNELQGNSFITTYVHCMVVKRDAPLKALDVVHT